MNKEINILKSLKHKHIVTFIGVAKYQGENYIIMEFMNHGSLLNYIRVNHNITQQTLKDMALQIADGMSYLEEKDIIHR